MTRYYYFAISVILNLFQHLVNVFSAFGRHTLHPRPQDGVFRCDLNKVILNLVQDLS
jgi:hypothetical protein